VQEAEEAVARCQLLEKSQEQLGDHNAALTEQVEGLEEGLQRSSHVAQQAQQDAETLQQVRGDSWLFLSSPGLAP
jgi:hypothetical protein